MNASIRELVGWSLDDTPYRPAVYEARIAAARDLIASEPMRELQTALVETPPELAELLKPQAEREDLVEEMGSLDWSLGTVDIRHVLGFQRRLTLDRPHFKPFVPCQGNWAGLIAVTLSPPRAINYSTSGDLASGILTLTSPNPDLHLRASSEPYFPLRLHAGSPFLEVAHYRGRWILRDGYHRSQLVLAAAVHHVPAVIIEARSLAEVGAIHPWFFSEAELFSPRPPRPADFLNDALTIEYPRPQLHKTIRIRVEETFEPNETPGDPL